MQEVVIRVLDDLRGCLRYRWAALLAAWLICLLGWLAVVSLPSVYEATARVYLNSQGALRPLLRGIAIEPDVESELDVVRQAMLSKPQLERVAVDTGLDPGNLSPEEHENLIDGLRQRIIISRDSRGAASDGVYRIGFQYEDRAKSVEVVKTLLNTFVEGTLGGKRTGQEDAQKFLREQIADYEKRLSESEGRLADFKKQNLGQMPTDQGDYFKRLQTEMTELSAVRANLAVAVARRAELARQMSGEDPFIFGLDSDLGTRADPTGGAGDVSARIQELEKRREELLIRFTEKHPEVQATDKTLGELRARRDAEIARVREGQRATGDLASSLKVNPVFQSIQVEAKRADVQIAELRQDLAQREASVGQLRRMVNTVPEVEAELARLNRDYEVTRSQYQALIQRLETAKLSNDADKTGTVEFRVIDPPAAPIEPIAPNRLVMILLVLVVGLAGGAALAYGLNLLKPAFHSWRRVALDIGAPVVGYVAHFTTPEEAQRLRTSRLAFTTAAVALFITCAAAMIWSDIGSRVLGSL